MAQALTLSKKVVPSSTRSQALPIFSVTPFTMLDFPDRTACIIWFSGCNMRCVYCHNPQIVKGRGREEISDVMAFLEKRQGLLDGVVLSGGEASAYPGLPDFIKNIRDLGYAVKLDTNGLRPDIIKDFLAQGFLDYVALDYKAPSHKFKKVTGVSKYNAFKKTLSILSAQNAVPFEIRTTVHTDLLDEGDINEIINDLKYQNFTGDYYIQNFRADDDRPTLGVLAGQRRILDRQLIQKTSDFTVSLRNF